MENIPIKEFGWYRHVKRKTICQIINKAKLQINNSFDMLDVVVYQEFETKNIWVRPTTEFCDGRFEMVIDVPTVSQLADEFIQIVCKSCGGTGTYRGIKSLNDPDCPDCQGHGKITVVAATYYKEVLQRIYLDSNFTLENITYSEESSKKALINLLEMRNAELTSIYNAVREALQYE
jgi:hypothetical protein